jgi:hypothetical protein
MTKKALLSRFLTGVLLAGVSVHGAIILDVPSQALVTGDPVQTGRLSRNAIMQDWTGTELFPGVINTGVTYHYHVYSVNVGITPFIQIDFDSLSANTFISAYDTSYLPDSAGGPNFGFDTHWLGDAGSSGNFFGTDPISFQVVVPMNHTLLVVVNNTGSGNVGVGDAFNTIIVEGFIDTQFDAPPAVPEPSALYVSGCGLVLVCLIGRLRSRRQSPKPAFEA